MGLLFPLFYNKNCGTTSLSNRQGWLSSLPIWGKLNLCFSSVPGCGCWRGSSRSSCSAAWGHLSWAPTVVTGLTGSIREALGRHNTSQQNYSWQGCADGNAYLCHLKPTRDTRIRAITINRKKPSAVLVTTLRCIAVLGERPAAHSTAQNTQHLSSENIPAPKQASTTLG